MVFEIVWIFEQQPIDYPQNIWQQLMFVVDFQPNSQLIFQVAADLIQQLISSDQQQLEKFR